MNKIIISGIIGAVILSVMISIVAIQMTSTDEEIDMEFDIDGLENFEKDFVSDSETLSDIESQIEEKYNELEEKFNGTEKYVPAPRQWLSSGPFSIDRSQYRLGELIFVQVDDLLPSEKGQIAFLRSLNDTHSSVYITIPFDGSNNEMFNQYFKPALSAVKKICTTDDLIGSWAAVFQGTNYETIHFEIIDKFIPGDEKYFEDAC